MKRTLFLLILLMPVCLPAQTITTIAGNGTIGFTGDGGPASAALVNQPGYVTVDTAGNLYITDEGNDVIRKVNSAGIISAVAGMGGSFGYSGDGGAATAAQLGLPKGVAFDRHGSMYIADAQNYVIRKVNTAGIISTVAGNNISGYMGDGSPATAAELSDVHAVAVDTSGNIYIADFSNSVVRKVNTLGIISTFAGTGTPGYSGDGHAATSAELTNPTGLAVDSVGNVYIADARSETVRKVNTAGIISTFAGTGAPGYSGDGGAASAAVFNLPHAVNIDDSGNVYICDAGNNVIRKVNRSGIVHTLAGNGTAGYSGDYGPATDAELNTPYGTAVDNLGNLYIADLNNNRIRKVTYTFNASFYSASFYANADTTCQDSCITFINSSTGHVDSVRWSIPGMSISNPHSDTVIVCFLSAGNDTVTLYAFDSGRVDSFVQVVTVKQMPHPTVTDTLSCGYKVPDIYLSYEWYSWNGTANSLHDVNYYIISPPGDLSAGTYVVVDSNGCLGNSDTLVSPCGDAVKNITEPIQEIKLFPNPVANFLTVAAQAPINQITITNLLGQIVLSSQYNTDQVQVDVSSFAAGLYFVKVNGSEVGKFCKTPNPSR